MSRASGDQKPRKLRGDREWRSVDEPESDGGEPSRQRATDAAVTGDGGDGARSGSRGDSRRSEEDSDGSRAAQQRRERRDDGDGPSDTDAMGQDKRREVIGQRYGASRARQLLYYGLFIAFLVAIYVGGQAAVSHLDKAPAHDKDQAPWSKSGAPQQPLGGFEPRTRNPKGPTRFQ